MSSVTHSALSVRAWSVPLLTSSYHLELLMVDFVLLRRQAGELILLTRVLIIDALVLNARGLQPVSGFDVRVGSCGERRGR